MATAGITLKRADELLSQVEPILSRLFARIEAVFPGAELHHIGSTAIPGSVTKGDIDILFRVAQSQFGPAWDLLQRHSQIKQSVNWTPHFASFGDDDTYGIPVGLQLVAKDSESDFFLFQRDYLLAHPEAVEAYNRIKTAHAADGPDRYWKAKDEFFARIIALWSKSIAQPSNPSSDRPIASDPP